MPKNLARITVIKLNTTDSCWLPMWHARNRRRNGWRYTTSAATGPTLNYDVFFMRHGGMVQITQMGSPQLHDTVTTEPFLLVKVISSIYWKARKSKGRFTMRLGNLLRIQ
jgi:hypothetical protein